MMKIKYKLNSMPINKPMDLAKGLKNEEKMQ